MAEWIRACKAPEIPINELPIETIVIADEERAAFSPLLHPSAKTVHYSARVVKVERLFTCEAADGQRIGHPFIGDRPQAPVKDAVKRIRNKNSAKTDHAVVARNRSVCLYIYHHVRHDPGP